MEPGGSAGPAAIPGRPRAEGDWLIGTGMATATYPVAPLANPQRARARLYADGTAVVQAATPISAPASPRS